MAELLTSAEAAQLAGVGTTAIKRWADSGALPCLKTNGGHRRFRRHDVEALVLSEAVAAGASRWQPWIDALTTGFDRHNLLARLYELRARDGSWHRAADGIGELLTELGARWTRGEISVGEEHVATSRLERAIATVSESLPVPRDAPSCVLATAEGDDHTLGLSLVELCLSEAGWRVHWLGRRTRAEDVVDRIDGDGVDMVALSASVHSRDENVLARMAQSVGEACGRVGVALAVGGRGAWPASIPHGQRFHDLETFYRFAARTRRLPV